MIKTIRFGAVLIVSVLLKLYENPLAFRRQALHFLSNRASAERLTGIIRVTFPETSSSSQDTCVPDVGLGEMYEYEDSFDRLGLFAKLRELPNYARARRVIESINGEIAKSGELSGGGVKHVLLYLNNAAPYTNSGYTVRTAGLIQSFAESGISVFPVTKLGYPASIGKRPLDDEEDGLLKLMPIRYPFGERARRKKAIEMLLKHATDHNIDAIHATTGFENAQVASQVAKELGIPWIYEIRGEPHNTWLSQLPSHLTVRAKNSSLYKMSAAKEVESAHAAAAVVVLSDIAKEKLVSEGVNPEKIYTIPNGVNLHKRASAYGPQRIRQALNLKSGSKVIGVISALVDYEGIQTAIEAMQELPERYRLLIVGHGEYRVELEDRARTLQVSDRVTFVGSKPQETIVDWYACLDAFLVPRMDHDVCRNVTPIKPLQALALGVPVVTSDLPALREITGGYARYVIPGDPNALAAGIEHVCQNPMDFQAEKTWLESHSWNSNAVRLKDLYSDSFRTRKLG